MFLSNKYLQYIVNKTDKGTKLSIYIPTHPASSSPTISKDTIRFKNTLQNVKTDKRYDEHELGETLKKLESLLDNPPFWKYRTRGLAVFADVNGHETIDLNYEITEMQYIQDAFVISPLAIMLSIGTGYYVLDINHTKPRLVHFSSYLKKEVATDSMPGSFEETVERDEYQKQQQHQSAAGNMFHGHDKSAALDDDTLRYYKLIAKAVDEYLEDHDEPLLLTGTQNRIGNMKPLINYQNVMKEIVVGSSEELNEQQLQEASVTVIENAEIENRQKLVKKVKNTPLSKLALGPKEIEAAILAGRVETLYLSSFRKTADNVRENNESALVLQLPKNIKSVESLVRGVLLQGGNVVAVEQGSFDNDEPLALCRF